MAQIESTGSVPPRLIQAGRSHAGTGDTSASIRIWAPKIAVAAAIIAGGILAYTAPAVKLEGGATLDFDAVSDKLTDDREWVGHHPELVRGDHWRSSAAFVFPRSERFVQTIAVTSARSSR